MALWQLQDEFPEVANSLIVDFVAVVAGDFLQIGHVEVVTTAYEKFDFFGPQELEKGGSRL